MTASWPGTGRLGGGLVAVSVPSPCRGIAALFCYLAAGQLIGHSVLASGYGHSAVVSSPGMVAAHLLAGLGCAVVIGAAERLCVVVTNRLVRLVSTSKTSSRPGRVSPRRRRYRCAQGPTREAPDLICRRTVLHSRCPANGYTHRE
jgi:hypothetical protein